MQLLLIAILAKFKQSIHKAVQLTTILLAKKALKSIFNRPTRQIDSINTSISSLQTQAASNYSTGSYDTSATNQIESLRQQELTQAETQLTQITQEKENLPSAA